MKANKLQNVSTPSQWRNCDCKKYRLNLHLRQREFLTAAIDSFNSHEIPYFKIEQAERNLAGVGDEIEIVFPVKNQKWLQRPRSFDMRVAGILLNLRSNRNTSSAISFVIIVACKMAMKNLFSTSFFLETFTQEEPREGEKLHITDYSQCLVSPFFAALPLRLNC